MSAKSLLTALFLLSGIGLTGTALGAEIVYQYDDGSSETSIGLAFEPEAPQPETIWLNAFQAAPGAPTTITSIDIAYGENNGVTASDPVNGSPVNVYIWSDPNNDGDPTDAVIVGGPIATTVQLKDTDTFVNVALPDTLTFSAGQWFFAGFQSTGFAAGIDGSSSLGRSWVAAGWPEKTSAEPDNLAGANLFGTIEDLTPGNFLIRVNGEQSNALYRYDDGSSETSIGQVFEPEAPQPETIWLNAFQAAPGAPTTITSIDIAYGENNGVTASDPVNGSPVNVYIWSDPNNDGDPTDAVIVGGPIATTVQLKDTDTFVNVALPDTLTFSAGQWFFAGFQSTGFAAGIDRSSSLGRSWVAAGWPEKTSAEPDNLAGANLFGTIEDLTQGAAGNFLIRVFADGPNPDADDDGVTDDADSFPADASETTDTDDDGVGDNTDVFPSFNTEELTDTDGDGAPDVCDQACQDSGATADPFVNAVTQKTVAGVVVTAEPTDSNSSAKLMAVEKLPFTPPAEFIGVAVQIAFEVEDLSMTSLETIQVEIDFGEELPADGTVYKVTPGGELIPIEDAVIVGTVVRYSITDNDGVLDTDPVQGKIVDPIVVGIMSSGVATGGGATSHPVPATPFWLLALLGGLLMMLGLAKLRKA